MKKMIANILILLTTFSIGAYANSAMHKVVIQVSSNNPKTQNLALNNAENLQKFYGAKNIKIEVVAFGPGLGILTIENKLSHRVASLVKHGITFSACLNTMHSILKKTGKLPILTKGVQTVPSGVARIIKLQEEGYSYVKP